MVRTIALLFIFSVVAYSQEAPRSPRQGLYQALESYGQSRYMEAYRKFSFLAQFYALDEHNTIFRFMAAKSLFMAGDHDKAQVEFKRFIKDFPASSYIAAAYLYLGHIAYLKGNIYESAVRYIRANDLIPGSKAASLAERNLRPLLEQELNADELSKLIDSYPKARLAGEIVFSLGKRHYHSQMYTSAVRLFEKYLENYTPGHYADEAENLLASARRYFRDRLVIGVLAPLSGTFADYGASLVEGVKLAFDDLDSIGGKEVELVIEDTQGSPVYATLAARQLIIEEPVAIIGPLRSESAVGAAIEAKYHRTPLISPTASEHGIASLGNSVYQISPPAEAIATAIAEYAVKEIGIKEFGIISPSDFTGRRVSRAFAQKVYQLGGEVLAVSFYEPGQVDFSNQIKPLREVLLMKTEELLASQVIDSTEYFDFEKEEWLDQEDWRVYLGGLFLPGYPEELSLLVPQIRYHVISTQYLGLDGWDSQTLITDIDRYIQGAVFASDYRAGADRDAPNGFYEKYFRKTKREPDRVAALAYDAANLVKDALVNGASTAEEVNSFLSSVEGYDGAGCIINFKSTNRSNNAVSIYVIEDQTIRRLQ